MDISPRVLARIRAGENPIQVVREQRCMPIAKIAKKVGISAAALIELEAGCQRADDALLGHIAAALGVPIEFLRVPAGADRGQAISHGFGSASGIASMS